MRKQNDYLAELLTEVAADDDATALPRPAIPERQRGLNLLTRETTLARVASGEIRQVTQLALDPARVRVWGGNARTYSRLSEASCRELIDSLIAENGQKVPAIVRRIEGEGPYDYEVIAGTRRHWAISWLRANSYPDMMFLAQVHALDDEAAFRIADIENRARKDVSDVERARNYAKALGTHYGGHLTRMAERLNISKGWLSKMVKVAGVGDEMLVAFADPAEVSLASIYPLAQALDDRAFAKQVASSAKAIAKQQAERIASGIAPFPASDVIKMLRQAGKPSNAKKFEAYCASSQYGRTLLSVPRIDRQGITIRLHNGSGASRTELLDAVRRALDWLEEQGQGLAK